MIECVELRWEPGKPPGVWDCKGSAAGACSQLAVVRAGQASPASQVGTKAASPGGESSRVIYCVVCCVSALLLFNSE